MTQNTDVKKSVKKIYLIYLTPSTQRFLYGIALLVLAGFAIKLEIFNPEVWGFLGTALGLMYLRSK